MPLPSLRDRMQAAARMRVPRITTAPSCRGVLGSKIFSKRAAEIWELSEVPVSVMSFRPICCSITISAPTRRRLRVSRQLVISRTTASFSSRSAPGEAVRSAPLPICSSALRSSGWNKITSTTAPLLTTFSSTQFRAVSPSRSLTQAATISMTRPFSTALARVSRVSISSLYRIKATMRISTISVRVGR